MGDYRESRFVPRLCTADTPWDPSVADEPCSMTCAGKSTFVQKLVARSNVGIGHGLQPKIKPHFFTHSGRRCCHIDTPGFDDTYLSYDTITVGIMAWLADALRNGAKLNGVIYFHSIKEPRLQGSSREYLRMFRKLCGEASFQNVVLATTFWDVVDVATAERREDELSSGCWARLLENGAAVARSSLENDTHDLMFIEKSVF
ncbi:hypothetical protein G7Z17_g3935 [Cylindrodendrum hubeiense]|uniref:G domain-containing protein n=1 Tax=Cylindrodendrum hubeiense TaxID=595255 RepID=A0A9P5HFV8_9HYPO|nr:hypothetical protein G7Z17_g3935 [Cylindrodendrum hubeiense]